MGLPKLDYKALFHDPRMFNSRNSFVAAGFEVLKQASEQNIMVGRHPAVDRYLFKKYSNEIPLSEQNENYETRMEGAERIRAVIRRQRLRHLVVPNKWLLELPRNFSDKKRKSYLLVVDRIDILSVDESVRRYRTIEPEVLDDLCHVLFRFRGFDAAIHNLRFTPAGQIAFIDTESWDRSPRPGKRVFRRIEEELTKESRKRVDRMFDRLDDDDDD